MPVVIPNTFTSSTNVEAAPIQANNEAVRKYINGKGIVQADLLAAGVDTEDIIRGEAFNVLPDHQFTTCDVYSSFTNTETLNRSYVTGEWKTVPDYTTTTQYVTVEGSGKQIFLEEDGLILIHGYYAIVFPVDINPSLNLHAGSTDQDVYIKIDGSRPSTSRALAFTEDTVVPANSGSAVATMAVRRSYPISYLVSKTAGMHTISLVINVNTSYGYVSAKNLSIEAIYI